VRVNFIGNLANNHYVLAKGLRSLGVDARLYYQDNGFHSLPQADDPEIANGPLPDWLVLMKHHYTRWRQSYYLPADFRRELAECDTLHAHGMGLIWAAQTGRPYIWHPYGSDLTYLSFHSRELCLSRGGGAWRVRNYPNLLLPSKMRWAIRRASGILFGWHNALWRDGYAMVRRLGAEQRVKRFHLAIDSQRFSPVSEPERTKLRAKLLPDIDVQRPFIFHPTRQSFATKNALGYKANDRLYRALGEYARGGGTFTLVIVENGLPDERVAREILSEESVAGRVRWIKPQPRHQLVNWYRAADLTVESFWTGAIGSVPLESMACGTPVMMHLRTEPETEDAIFLDPKELFNEMPPIVRCSTVSEIASQLRSLTPERLNQLGVASRNWIERFASIEATSQRLLELHRSILSPRAVTA
jgi:glycosyltransferase involved in cell wall biosynthesis